MPAIRLVTDSALEHSALIGLAVRGICSQTVPDEGDAYLLELCVVEAVSNVVRHAYGSRAGHRVEVEVEALVGKLVFRVRDLGLAMDPAVLDAPPLRAPGSLEEVPEGGMGLHIIRDTMDEVAYVSDNGRNELTMVKLLPPPEPRHTPIS